MTKSRSRKKQNSSINYGVIGLGSTGCSVVEFLIRQGCSVIAMDTRSEPPLLVNLRSKCPDFLFVAGSLDYDILKHCEEVVISPGVPLEHPTLKRLKDSGKKMIGDIELFIRHAEAPLIGITGTNGKTTVTTMVQKMLMSSGVDCLAGGNLGTPALDLLLKNPTPDCYLLEISSFQLLLVSDFKAEISCLLNITHDHLDRHFTFEAYQAIKISILASARIALVNLDDLCIGDYVATGKKIGFSSSQPVQGGYGVRLNNGRRTLCDEQNDFLTTDQLKLIGQHNELNALAALAICSEYMGVVPEAAVEALKDFGGLPHRMEKIAVIRDVVFVNDSKATNLAAAQASITCLMSLRRGIVILGGESKQTKFDVLSNFLSDYVHTAILIGEAAPEIEEALVDMFDDYAHRGNIFRAAVLSLEVAA
jgi:UDP-N-acetylmuramoylalanine--D-glutamate ligase